MSDETMFVEERKVKILEYIEENKKATVAQLCDNFKVSSATIRNDLRDLESSNLILRTHGGAMLKTKTGFELESDHRQIQNLEAKREIAQTALGLIEDGDTIILDTGTTTTELSGLLNKKHNLTVVTNDLGIALLLEEFDMVNVMLMGGILRKHFHCTLTFGTTGKTMLSGLTVDKAFMGVNSFSFKKGASTPDINQAETKKLMISIAATVILLCDSSKLGQTSFAQFATIEEIDTLVTNDMQESDRKRLEESGLQIFVTNPNAQGR
ncbi:MAG TPA: DeoR/GlpR transcriptional regulator [bacterium]|nr:DeoR/GlpR transcriptional regulator [bacterium]